MKCDRLSGSSLAIAYSGNPTYKLTVQEGADDGVCRPRKSPLRQAQDDFLNNVIPDLLRNPVSDKSQKCASQTSLSAGDCRVSRH
ncbi:MAG: hypothetical protein DWP97_14110 [Calditrichaeota bacterium]|nr:MAG: hypothetical protein DWP97_14110 [Calditrichota bacterium]